MRASYIFGTVILAAALSAQATAQDAQTDAQDAPPQQHQLLKDIVNDVQASELKDDDYKLVSFGTRHTLSDTQSKTRGIGAAREWVKKRFEEFSKVCGGCLDVEMPQVTDTGERLPGPTVIADVVAIQRGTTDPNRVIVITGHIDTRVRDVMDAKSNAPGADDDGSGTSAVIEAARVLSKHKFPATLVFSVDSGEEQGLYGGKLIAQYAVDRNWNVEASLNNDIVGNTTGTNGVKENGYVRVFSEGTRSTETPKEAMRRNYFGGEVDSPSRNLARFVSRLADDYLGGFKGKMIYRTDRYGRGGDQVPMLRQGYPAIRFTEAIEDYHHEHQDVRVENGIHYGDTPDQVDFPYLANVTRLNAIAMAALAMAPMPPPDVKIKGAVTMDTTVSWSPSPGANSYRVWWRDTTAPQWTYSRAVPGNETSVVLKNINIDDWFFGVSAVSADGWASPVEFPGPTGSFQREPPSPEATATK